MSQVQVRAGWIHAQFDPQRPAEGQLLTELCLADDLRAALLEKGKGFVRLHVGKCRPERYLFLFNNSRTCSIVRGVLRALKAFWLLP